MESVACTFNGRAHYNNGWNYTSFSTAENVGHPAWGKDYYGHNRCIVLKITTPSFSGAANKRLQINMLMCRSSYAGAGYDTFYYRITTTAPSFSEGGATQLTFPDSYMCCGTIDVYSPSQDSGYAYNTLNLNTGDFQPNTTYYIWLWSDTPYVYGSNYYTGYYAHSSSYGGLIKVNMLYEPGVVMIDNGSEFLSAIPYIDTGSEWVQAIPYVDTGSDWEIA